MRKSKKEEAFKQFYFSMDGKKLIAFADMFLDQLRLQIQTGMVDDFTRNYRYKTELYEFLFNFTCDYDSSVQFIIRDRKNRYDLLSIYYCPDINEFLEDECWACLSIGNDSHLYNALKLPYFNGVLTKVISVNDARTLDLFIPFELVEQIERRKMDFPEDHMAHAKHILTQHRKSFSKTTFASVAHTLKFIEETLPLMATSDFSVDELTEINHLEEWLSSDIPQVIEEHALLQEHQRTANENPLLEKFHRYYLKALDIRERI